MSLFPQLIRGEPRRLNCPLCVLERPNNPNKIFKNCKAISNHLRISHDLSNDEFDKVRQAIRESVNGIEVNFSKFRGLLN
ncbi:hypothetical protein AAA799B03_01098 [Marine Group I thaumarchaeote SCGC AAA799-B03]|uniref:Uncharacterized protein n=1 Tax=Marine Group I thaumarchaeote SCGC AAA799-B03 TaxID=1502289 RepID=A0A087S6L2_9ARCH|nr:hypothetical protein AAA799B03_01098 [Marine Group I thaumarchaeote SCGC AAA799-B03]